MPQKGHNTNGDYRFVVEHFYDEAGNRAPHFHAARLPDRAIPDAPDLPSLYQYFKNGGKYRNINVEGLDHHIKYED